MKIEVTEAVWTTSETVEIGVGELCERTGLTSVELRELVAQEVLSPVNPSASEWAFAADCLSVARTACRLRADLELDPHGVAIVVSLLGRVRELERALQALRARMPG